MTDVLSALLHLFKDAAQSGNGTLSQIKVAAANKR